MLEPVTSLDPPTNNHVKNTTTNNEKENKIQEDVKQQNTHKEHKTTKLISTIDQNIENTRRDEAKHSKEDTEHRKQNRCKTKRTVHQKITSERVVTVESAMVQLNFLFV